MKSNFTSRLFLMVCVSFTTCAAVKGTSWICATEDIALPTTAVNNKTKDATIAGPRLISTTPVQNGTNISRDANIVLNFDVPMNQVSADGGTDGDITDDNIQIRGEQTGLVSGVFSGNGTNTLTFNPDVSFKPGEVVTVTITTGLVGVSGGRLGTDFTFRFTAAPALVSPINFKTQPAITTDAGLALSVYAADVDGDGDMDVLSASQDDKIAWYENDGSQSFTSHTITTDANGAASVYAADVDGDGDLDVLSASLLDDKIAWYENDGSQGFTSHTITTDAAGAHSVYAADVDGDGDMDVLSASNDDDKIAWYENDGSQGFTSHTITTDAAGAHSVYAADVDGDGDMDVLSASFDDNKIAWYENDGSQGFTSHIITTDADHASSVYAADVDDDGDLDVLSASRNDSKIGWYENVVSPRLISTTPVQNGTNISRDANIVLNFDNAINQVSADGGTDGDITDDNIQIRGEQTGLVSG
ncbi:MAG: Ig-like domain-containing protein, partial [Cytophagales bacterium]|nr:Ig-like domain-containing protein [Cytophagales bacterium]